MLSSAAPCATQISPAKTDREYWQRVMPEALAEHDKQVRHRTGSVPEPDMPALPGQHIRLTRLKHPATHELRMTAQSSVPRLHAPTSQQQLEGHHVDLQEAAKATAALVVGKRQRKKANYIETKQPAGAASDGDGGADDPPSDADCVPMQEASSSDSDTDDESGQVRD